MSITRTTLLSGPASATFNGHTFFAYDGIVITPALELDDVDSDANGWLDETIVEAPVTIKFTPFAPWENLAALYPWLDGAPGTSLFGDTDSPLVLVAANGVRITFASAAIISMPDMTLAARGSLAGAVTFLALGARTMPITAADRLLSIDTAVPPIPPPGVPQLADDFVVTWGNAPWSGLRALDGVRVHFELKTKPVFSDANALLDLTLDRLEVHVRFAPATPFGPGESDFVSALQLQGENSLPGRALSATAQTLDIAGEHLWLRLPLAQLAAGSMTFDPLHPRLGDLLFVASRAFLEAGAPLATLTEGPPLA